MYTGNLQKIKVSGTCSICLEDVNMKEPTKIVITKCRHAFHEDCITTHLNLNESTTISCPNCRQFPTPMVRVQEMLDKAEENPYIECKMLRALRDNDLEYVKAALLAKPSLVDDLYVNKKNNLKYSLLTLAAMFGRTDLVVYLLDKVKKESIDKFSFDGLNALSVASLLGHTQIVEILLNAGAQANCINADGKSALWFAAHAGKKDLVKLLVKSGASVTNRSTKEVTALFMAAQQGHLEVVNYLIHCIPKEELKEHINICSTSIVSPATALFMAAQAGHTDIVSSLLLAGAEPNQAIGGGQIPLHIAASNGHLETIKILIEKGADIEYQRPDGATALFLGAAEGRREVCEYLLRANANRALNCIDFFGRPVTAANVARNNGHFELAEYIDNYQY